MPSTLTVTFMVIFCLESLAAMLQNGFVVTVLGREWVQSRVLPVADMIVACVASSRFCLHGLAILQNFLIFFGFCYHANFFGIFWNFFNTLISWLTVWLAIVYCVKISSFSHPIFSWLKWRISQLVPRMLLGSLITAGISAIVSSTKNVIAIQVISQDSPENCSFGHKTLTFYWYYYFSHSVFMWLIPFFLVLVSTVLLMFSLYQHVGQMRDRRSGPRDPSTQAHTMALKSLAFFLISYTLYFLPIFISAGKITDIQGYGFWAVEVMIYAGMFLHSATLVLSRPKLRKALKMRFRACVPPAPKAFGCPWTKSGSAVNISELIASTVTDHPVCSKNS